jgi:hypothetical protein
VPGTLREAEDRLITAGGRLAASGLNKLALLIRKEYSFLIRKKKADPLGTSVKLLLQ